MVGALNKLPISIAGMIFFDGPVTFGGVVGVFMVSPFFIQPSISMKVH